MAATDPETGSKPASRENPLLYTFVAMCEPCLAVWVSACLMSNQHAIIAMRLPWLCPDCHRPLAIKSVPKREQPDGKPC
jgi:hypothetical protein